MKLNGIDVTTLKHEDISKLISSFANHFEISIIREQIKKNDSLVEQYQKNHNDEKKHIQHGKENGNNDNIEDHIAEIMSGEAEILKAHNIIG